jgi:hypothetical protein
MQIRNQKLEIRSFIVLGYASIRVECTFVSEAHSNTNTTQYNTLPGVSKKFLPPHLIFLLIEIRLLYSGTVYMIKKESFWCMQIFTHSGQKCFLLVS